MAKLELPSDKEIASQLIKSQERLSQIGWIGRIVGTKEQAPSNIAGATALIAGAIALIATLALVWLLPAPNSEIAVRTLPPIISVALGYLFGKSGR